MKIALIQMTSGADVFLNLAYLTNAIREAVSKGALFISSPENSDFISDDHFKKKSYAYSENDHPFLSHLKIWQRSWGSGFIWGL
jgi:predicted amidohydrolase